MADRKNILVIRNDKLGDFMLAWPALSLLKKQYPDSVITVLIPSYTKPVAEICPSIDNIITDDQHKGTVSDALQLSRKLKRYNFDASISLYSEMRTSVSLWLAGIPQRIGPATKIAQLFLNNKLKQKRSLSLKPEYEYNLDLVRHYISLNGDIAIDTPPPPYLQFDSHELAAIRQDYIKENNIDADRKLIFIHAGSGGSAINLSPQQFAKLARIISDNNKVHFVLTSGPDELATASNLAEELEGIEYSIYHSTEGLVNFSKFISICDLFISGSTGPLHIAGALNIPVAAFYPARQSATSLRWQTTNEQEKRIAFMPGTYTGKNDMQTINIEQCGREIKTLLGHLYP